MAIKFRVSRQQRGATHQLEYLRGRKRIVVSEHAACMPDNLASCKGENARTAGAGLASVSGILSRMPKKPPDQFQIDVSNRLKALQAECKAGPKEMGDIVGVERRRWTNWIKYENLPNERMMVQLCEATGVSMEWLYRGRSGEMTMRLFIRLELRFAGLDPETATPEQMAPVAARVAASAVL